MSRSERFENYTCHAMPCRVKESVDSRFGKVRRGLTDYQCSMCRKSIENLWMGMSEWLGSHRKHGIIKFLSSPFFDTHSLIHSLISPSPHSLIPSHHSPFLATFSSSAFCSWHSEGWGRGLQCANTIDSTGERGEYYRLSFSLISPFIFSCNDLSSFINDVLSIMW